MEMKFAAHITGKEYPGYVENFLKSLEKGSSLQQEKDG